MFTKIDKKVLAIGVVLLILLLAGGFFVYRYLTDIRSQVQNENEGANTQTQQEASGGNLQGGDDAKVSDVEIETETGGGLIICSDKCGDGICQAPEKRCDNLNCVCREDKQECPQDCK